MDREESSDTLYQPGEGCIPLTPQARRLGWVFPVYVTRAVWGECITWTYNKKQETSPDLRIIELLTSVSEAITAATAKYSKEEEWPAYFPFKHFYWEKNRPKATKKKKNKWGARLLMEAPERPWLLIFDPERDNEGVLNVVDTVRDDDLGTGSSLDDDPVST